MTKEEYESSMDALVKDLPEDHLNLMVGVANEALRMIKNRIQKTGIDANGAKFRGYSEWYQKYKTKAGYNKGFTDFSFTNRMWTNIQLIKEKTTPELAIITAMDKGQKGGYESVVVKGSKNKKATSKKIYVPSNYEKLEKNTTAFGVILDLSTEEQQILVDEYDNGILQIFRDHGL
jgi:hypothetical protein